MVIKACTIIVPASKDKTKVSFQRIHLILFLYLSVFLSETNSQRVAETQAHRALCEENILSDRAHRQIQALEGRTVPSGVQLR